MKYERIYDPEGSSYSWIEEKTDWKEILSTIIGMIGAIAVLWLLLTTIVETGMYWF